ncbi:MAG: hypothetical protein Q4B57_01270 [Eubacteriales bacterium]|nr:hypothetical protein [Eubacteriales bacterium]
MDDQRTSRGCPCDCPCYPRCDEMMQQEGIPQSWRRETLMQSSCPLRRDDNTPCPNFVTEDERDWQRLRELYPDMAKILLGEVEETCDRMEYEGSVMFDVVPEQERVWNMTEQIVERVQERIGDQSPAMLPEEMSMMQHGRCRNCRPGQDWLGDFVQVMLYQEMFRRRCRHRHCRQW